MRSNKIAIVIALFLGAAIGAGVVSCTKAPMGSTGPTAQAAPPGQQWEYKAIDTVDAKDQPDKVTKKFNELAADGWEYSGTVSWYTAIFRRAKK